MKKKHWFQYLGWGVFSLFMAIMAFATYIAFSRQSGVTDLDMAKIQKIRFNSVSPK